MFRSSLRKGVLHVGEALREPEAFALRWQRGEVRYDRWVCGLLLLMASLGTFTYGMSIGILESPREALLSGLQLSLSAGLS